LTQFYDFSDGAQPPTALPVEWDTQNSFHFGRGKTNFVGKFAYHKGKGIKVLSYPFKL